MGGTSPHAPKTLDYLAVGTRISSSSSQRLLSPHVRSIGRVPYTSYENLEPPPKCRMSRISCCRDKRLSRCHLPRLLGRRVHSNANEPSTPHRSAAAAAVANGETEISHWRKKEAWLLLPGRAGQVRSGLRFASHHNRSRNRNAPHARISQGRENGAEKRAVGCGDSGRHQRRQISHCVCCPLAVSPPSTYLTLLYAAA